jgi:lysophospholipase L1-like esterase
VGSARHRLVVVGDSLTQGFMSGAIHRADISFPAMLGDAMGIRGSLNLPDFEGAGGLPVNLERLLKELSSRYGSEIGWLELAPALRDLRKLLHEVEVYWERGPGSEPRTRPDIHHNLSVWGFEVGDAYLVTEGVCRRAIPSPNDDSFHQIPEMSMYRTARRVLNPTFSDERMEWHQMRCVQAFASDGGVENLLVLLGANNALGTVTSLSIRPSEWSDLERFPHERRCNLYRPEHFERLYERLAAWIEPVGAERVYVGNVPHVTIPPATRGVGSQDAGGYFEFYTRPWIWDDHFEPDRHPRLTREQVRRVDSFVDEYNAIIERMAAERGWWVIDLRGALGALAYRRNRGRPTYEFPAGLVAALEQSAPLRYLLDEQGRVVLDTRFLCLENDDPTRVAEGGLISLDGLHPTTIGYGLLADLVLGQMQKHGVASRQDLDWDAIVAWDTLVNRPPAVLRHLKRVLEFLDRRGLFSAILELLG